MNKSAIKIGYMDIFDVDAVYTIEQRCGQSFWTRDIFYHCLMMGYSCYVLYYIDDTKRMITGYFVYREVNNTIHLLNLCIDRACQGQGLGRFALDYIQRQARKKVILDAITLEVRVSNGRAIRLYTKYGFTRLKILKNYYGEESQPEDAYAMKYFLYSDS